MNERMVLAIIGIMLSIISTTCSLIVIGSRLGRLKRYQRDVSATKEKQSKSTKRAR